MSKVNVIVPCYNGAKYLDRFFNSLLNQTFKDFDVFFVDDGSTDNSSEVVKTYIKIFEEQGLILNYFYKENGGAASAINVALKQDLTGKYLMIMDCDDELTPDSLALRVDYLEKNPDCGAVTSYYNFVDNETNKIISIVKNKGIVNKKEKTFTNILSANRIVFTAYMFDKEKLFSVLKNNQIYESKQGQNWQLLLPLAHRFKIGKIKKILLNYFVIQSSHSHSVGSTKEKLVKRLNGLNDVLQNVLKEMDVLEEYSSYIEEFKFKYLVNTAYTLRDKVLMLENYKKYRKIGKFNLKLFVKYNLIKFGIKK